MNANTPRIRTSLRVRSTKKVSRLGFGGDLEEPNRWRSREDLQRQILEKVRERAPQVLEDLAKAPLGAYGQIPEQQHDLGAVTSPGFTLRLGSKPRAWSWSQVETEAEKGDTCFVKLRSELVAWAKRHFKDTPTWLLQDTLETLHDWRTTGCAQEGQEWSPVDENLWDHSPTLEEPPLFEFTFEGPRPWRESTAAWLKEANAAFQEQARTFLGRQESEHEALGLVPTPEKRASWHIEAFVDYQVRGIGKTAILSARGDKDGITSLDAVRKAIAGIADQAGIKLRAEQSGRPVGVRDARRRMRASRGRRPYGK